MASGGRPVEGGEKAATLLGQNRKSTPSRSALATASQMGTLLRAFARRWGSPLSVHGAYTPASITLTRIRGARKLVISSRNQELTRMPPSRLSWLHTREMTISMPK